MASASRPCVPAPPRGEHHQPEAEECRHAAEHDEHPPGVVVEPPRTNGVKASPDHDAEHDPADDSLSVGLWGTIDHATIVVASPDHDGQRRKRPPERPRVQGGGEPGPFPGAIGRTCLRAFARGRRLASMPPPTSSGAGSEPTPWPSGGGDSRTALLWGQCRFRESVFSGAARHPSPGNSPTLPPMAPPESSVARPGELGWNRYASGPLWRIRRHAFAWSTAR